MSHTPGPWRVRRCSDGPQHFWIDAAGIVVAELDATNDEPTNVEDDAYLIAAAPDLLAVCELALAFHGVDTVSFVARYGSGMTTRQLCDRIRETIAKATGGQS